MEEKTFEVISPEELADQLEAEIREIQDPEFEQGGED